LIWPFSTAMDYALGLTMHHTYRRSVAGDPGGADREVTVTIDWEATTLIGLSIYAVARARRLRELHKVPLATLHAVLADDTTARAIASLSPLGSTLWQPEHQPDPPQGTLDTVNRAALDRILARRDPAVWNDWRVRAATVIADAQDHFGNHAHLSAVHTVLREQRVRRGWLDHPSRAPIATTDESGVLLW
jgi:hypothetical protein